MFKPAFDLYLISKTKSLILINRNIFCRGIWPSTPGTPNINAKEETKSDRDGNTFQNLK